HSEVIEQLLQLFKPGASAAIVSHINPDGDAIGSVLALAELLEAMGMQVTKLLAREHALPQTFGFLIDFGLATDFVEADAYTDNPDILIAVDLSQASRMDKAQAVLGRAAFSICIDHHPNPDGFTDYLLHDQTAAATGYLVWQIIKASGVTITPTMAAACYIALITDTGRFSFQSNDSAVFVAAAEMVSAGADPVGLSLAIFDTRALNSLKLDARLIDRLDYLVEGKVVYSWATEADFAELGASRDDTENLISIVRSVAGAELAILLREVYLFDDKQATQVRVNLRASGDYNASKLASDHGGGGHQAAAGFNFAGTIPEAAEAIKHYLLSEGVIKAEAL
ncbi:MAG: DHH family phosphoesterase, partial [Coriobacteriia bacterium]|nr:DHH family phosphoesterase [Coriobacteriia bacterium]